MSNGALGTCCEEQEIGSAREAKHGDVWRKWRSGEGAKKWRRDMVGGTFFEGLRTLASELVSW